MLLDAKTREEFTAFFDGYIGLRGVFRAHSMIQEKNPKAFDRTIKAPGKISDTTHDIGLAMDLLDYTVKATPELKAVFINNPDAAKAFKMLAADMDHAAVISGVRVKGAGANAVARLGLEKII